MAGDCLLSLFTAQEDTDAAMDRQVAATTLIAEWMANMKAMRFELRAFVKAMAKAK